MENEQRRTTSLEHLGLARFRDPVDSYRNLFYHRTVVVEGIRKIAFRNMAHLSDAMGRQPSLESVRDDDWIIEVQRRMLHDQGMDDTPLNRTLIGWATYYPLQVYLALLYAEVEFYRKFCEGKTLLDDAGFSAYLRSREQFVEKLGGFRHFFLHPSVENAPSELGFLNVRGSYNLAPEVQSKVDEYLYGMRGRLLDVLLGALSKLPEIQRLYCLSEFLPKNHMRMQDHHDTQGQEHVLGQMKEVIDRLAEIGAEAASWSPRSDQEEKATTLATYLNEVSPSVPEQTYINLASSQTPMSLFPLSSLTTGSAPGSYGGSRYTSHVQRNLGEIRRVIIAAGVLQNEFVTGRGRFTPEQLSELAATTSKSEFANSLSSDLFSEGLHNAEEYSSLGRVGAALLYEPLRLYCELVKTTPDISRPGLEELAAPAVLTDLSSHRNSVFHVCKPTQEPLRADFATARPSSMDAIGRLGTELSAFFGLTSEELSNLF